MLAVITKHRFWIFAGSPVEHHRFQDVERDAIVVKAEAKPLFGRSHAAGCRGVQGIVRRPATDSAGISGYLIPPSARALEKPLPPWNLARYQELKRLGFARISENQVFLVRGILIRMPV